MGHRLMVSSKRNLHSLMYSSIANDGISKANIEAMLLNARHNNEQHNITGLLLYHDGAFLQVLEGDRRTISNLFEKKLMRDSRHKSVTLFHDEKIDHRKFRYWNLAYSDLTESVLGISAPYRELLNQRRSLFELNTNTHKALDLVRQIHRRVLCRPSASSSWDRTES